MGGSKRVFVIVILIVVFLFNLQKVQSLSNCANVSKPIDMMILIESSPIHLGNPSQLGLLKSSEYMLSKFNSSKDRVGVISYDNDIDFLFPLSSDFNAVNNSIYSSDFDGGRPELNHSINIALDYLSSNGRSDSFKGLFIVTAGDWNTTTYFQNDQRALELGIPIFTIMPSSFCNNFFMPCIHASSVRFNSLVFLSFDSNGYGAFVDPGYTQLDYMYSNISFKANTSQQCDSKNPVLLVHGIYSDDDMWKIKVNQTLTQAGYDVYLISSFIKPNGKTGLYPNNGDIKELSFMLKVRINEIKKKTGAKKVDIVAHSMGGLVTRWYIKSTDYDKRKDIDRLIMMGTPNDGASIADTNTADFLARWRLTNPDIEEPSQTVYNNYYGIEVVTRTSICNSDKENKFARCQMIPGSPFLKSLNSDFKAKGVNYFAIAGSQKSIRANLVGGAEYKNNPNDAVVLVNSVNNIPTIKQSQSTNCYVASTYHSDSFGIAYYTNDTIIESLMDLLNTNLTAKLRSCNILDFKQYLSPNVFSDTLRTEKKGRLQSNQEINSQGIQITDPTNSVTTMHLKWGGSDLDMILVSSNGDIINSSTSIYNENVSYYKNVSEAQIIYEIKNANFGNWTANVTAIDIPPGGENYTLTIEESTNLSLWVFLDDGTFLKNQQINITSTLFEGNYAPIILTNVTATVIRPDNLSEQLQLFDDGIHNDNQTNDGYYGNVYSNTNVTGMYLLSVVANTSRGLRLVFSQFFVYDYADLMLNTSSLSIAPTMFPSELQLLNVSVRVYNIGQNKATNISVSLFDQYNTSENPLFLGEKKKRDNRKNNKRNSK